MASFITAACGGEDAKRSAEPDSGFPAGVLPGAGVIAKDPRDVLANACARGNGGCAQLCAPTAAGAVCGCELPSVLGADGKSCSPATLSWSAPETVGTPALQDWSPKLATNGAGDAVLTWVQATEPPGGDVAVSRFKAGSWEAPSYGRPLAGKESAGAAAGIDGAGVGHVSRSFASRDAPTRASTLWQRVASSSPDAPGTQMTGPVDTAIPALLSVSASGSALALWRDTDGSEVSSSILANRYQQGSWGTPVRVAGVTRKQEAQGLVMNEAGAAVSVWLTTAGVVTLVSDGQTWTTPAPFALQGPYERLAPLDGFKLGIDAAGNAIALWGAGPSLRAILYVSYYDAARAAWSASQGWRVADGVRVGGLDFAMLPSGDAIAVWYQYTDDLAGTVMSSRYSHATGWTEERPLSTTQRDSTTKNVRVAMNATGSALALWVERAPAADGGVAPEYVLMSRTSSPRGDWSPAERVDTVSGEVYQYLQAGLADDGHALAVWLDDDGPGGVDTIRWSRR